MKLEYVAKFHIYDSLVVIEIPEFKHKSCCSTLREAIDEVQKNLYFYLKYFNNIKRVMPMESSKNLSDVVDLKNTINLTPRDLVGLYEKMVAMTGDEKTFAFTSVDYANKSEKVIPPYTFNIFGVSLMQIAESRNGIRTLKFGEDGIFFTAYYDNRRFYLNGTTSILSYFDIDTDIIK